MEKCLPRRQKLLRFICVSKIALRRKSCVTRGLRTKIHIERGDRVLAPRVISIPGFRMWVYGVSGTSRSIFAANHKTRGARRADGSVYCRAFSSSRAPLTEEGFAFAALPDLPRHLVKHAHVWLQLLSDAEIFTGTHRHVSRGKKKKGRERKEEGERGESTDPANDARLITRRRTTCRRTE